MRIAPGLTALLVTGTVAGMAVGNGGPAAAERRESSRPAEPASPSPSSPRPAGGARDAALTSGEQRPAAPVRGRLEPYLEPSEITAEVRPFSPAIERCYLARVSESRRGGKLDLKLLIGHEGIVVSTRVVADGLSPRAARKVEGCIREALAGLRFPPRRNDTMAVVPYYFQRTEAPGAGPQLSCWSPRGC